MSLGRSLFRKQGEFWTIVYARRLCRVRDCLGLRYFPYILGQPGTEILALDLAIAVRGLVPQRVALVQGVAGNQGLFPDPQARAAYGDRLRTLRANLEEAEHHNDIGRAANIQAEIESLEAELRREFGLHGRRKVGDPLERARVRVTKAIKRASIKITDFNPALGDHLRATIRTGTFCIYLPDPRIPIRWIF